MNQNHGNKDIMVHFKCNNEDAAILNKIKNELGYNNTQVVRIGLRQLLHKFKNTGQIIN